jgi:hypothetical protein
MKPANMKWKVFHRTHLQLNPVKCQLFLKEIWHLEHTASPGGVTADMKKLEDAVLATVKGQT